MRQPPRADKPILLDLFCGAGGASMGYHRAGFRVIGVDLMPQPHYPFEFHQADALQWPLDGYDAIHASPPCQAYSMANHIHGRTDHPDLIASVRERLEQAHCPYIIENVPGAPLHSPLTLCGLSFNLRVKRHRLFESNLLLFGLPCPSHNTDYVICFGTGTRGRAHQTGVAKGGGPVIYRPTLPLSVGQAAMGINWMSGRELSQAIPPAYTAHLGSQLHAAITRCEQRPR